MSTLNIIGGKPLNGEITVSGNKNAVLPMIASALLTDETVCMSNVPNIIDVNVMLEILDYLGCDISFSNAELTINSSSLKRNNIPRNLCTKIRSSILFVAPLLLRTGQAVIYPPGGDVIGRRRIDTHFYGLRSLGAKIKVDEKYSFTLEGKMRGADLFFDEMSVTATEHILMAAVLAEGETIIRNAASEPHVQDLAEMLVSMGANIKGINTNTLTVVGVNKLSKTKHKVVSDHIEAGSFLALTAATGGNITIHGIKKNHFWMIRRVFEKFGIELIFSSNSVKLAENTHLTIKKDFGGAIPVIDDGPWPAFPSDLMSSMLVLATQTEGTVLFFEKMFESRMFFVDKLIAMGSSAIICDPHRVVISGKSKLKAIKMSSPDIRAGIALVSAALAANGESEIQNAETIDRGYENIESKLLALGAEISRIK